jgi:hypothetical protein
MAAVTHAAAYDDALAREIAEAQAELNTAIDRAGLRNDAYGAVLRAQSAHLTAMHNILTAFQRDLVSAQPAFTDANMRVIGQQLSPSFRQLANTARIKMCLIAVFAGIAALMMVGTGCWFAGSASRDQEMVAIRDGLGTTVTSGSAQVGLMLMRLNDLARALAKCQPVPQPNGEPACAMTVWVDPPHREMAK